MIKVQSENPNQGCVVRASYGDIHRQIVQGLCRSFLSTDIGDLNAGLAASLIVEM